MDNPKVFFVSGVSGVGKTSTLKYLKELLPVSKYDVRDLDEKGVTDGGGFEWLKGITRFWLDTAKENSKSGKSTIICGFANPEIVDSIRTKDDLPLTIILLHASPETIRVRLYGRHSTPESIREIERAAGKKLDEWVEGCVTFSPEFHAIFKKRGYPIVDTDNKNPEEVTKEVISLLY